MCFVFNSKLIFSHTSLFPFAKTVVVVDFATKGDFFVQTFNNTELFRSYTLFVVAYTNENGDPVLLPNDGSANGNERKGSILEFLPNIAYGSLKFVEDLSPQCSYTKYQSEVDLIDQQVTLIANQTDLMRSLSYNVSDRCFVRIEEERGKDLCFIFSMLWRHSTVEWQDQRV